MNLLYLLHDIWGIDVIRLRRTDDLYKAFIDTPSIAATHLADLYGVRYVICYPLRGRPSFRTYLFKT